MFRMTQPALPEPPWRTAPRRRSAPRPQLSRDIVVEAALAVLAAGGGHALTMRRVAGQIGVSASALYGYVASKEELVQLVFDRIGEELIVPETATGWQEMLKEFGRNMLVIFRKYPGAAALTLGRAVATPSTLAVGERILAELRAAGIPDQVAAYVGDLGGLYVGGIAYELDVAPPGDQAEMAARLGAWMKSLPRDHYPNTVALADKLVAGTAEDRFEWGLDVIVRGLASYLDKPPDPSARWPAG
jgi:AcrR family transcriptional regulator